METTQDSLEYALRKQATELIRLFDETRALVISGLSLPELSSIRNEISDIDHRINDLVMFASKGSGLKINIGDEDIDVVDQLQNSLSSHNRMRRKQAKILARKLYHIYHEDFDNSGRLPWLSFSKLRNLANLGEIELLTYIRTCHGLDDSDPEKLRLLTNMIRTRMSIFQASPAFRVARLFVTNREAYIQEVRSLLIARKASLELRLAELYKMSGGKLEEETP